MCTIKNLQLCKTALVRKNTPWQKKTHQKLIEHKMCLAICIVTKPRMQGVDVCTDTVK